MAKVEMDMTEYEALKKVQAILETSLSTERVLRQELADVQQEALDAAKLNEKTVTIIKQIETIEHTTFLRPATEIHQALKTLFNNNVVDPMSYRMQARDSRGYRDQWAVIADAFFGKAKSQRLQDDTVTRRGFDEMKEEVRKEYFDLMTKDTEGKLESYKELNKFVKELKRDKSASDLILSNLEEELAQTKDLLGESNQIVIKQDDDSQQLSDLVKNIEATIDYTEGVFKSKKIVKSIQEAISSWKSTT